MQFFSFLFVHMQNENTLKSIKINKKITNRSRRKQRNETLIILKIFAYLKEFLATDDIGFSIFFYKILNCVMQLQPLT